MDKLFKKTFLKTDLYSLICGTVGLIASFNKIIYITISFEL